MKNIIDTIYIKALAMIRNLIVCNFIVIKDKENVFLRLPFSCSLLSPTHSSLRLIKPTNNSKFKMTI